MPYSIDTSLTISITGLSHDGKGIGKIPQPDGRSLTVFVKDALPGQIVQCKITGANRAFLKGSLLEVIQPVPEHNQTFCPHWQDCGACPLQPLPQDQQIFWKEEILRNALTKIGRLPADTISAAWQPAIPSPLLVGFRNKITLAFGNTGQLALGLRARQSHRIIPVHCNLMPPTYAPIAAETLNFARACPEAKDLWRFLTLRYGQTLDNPAPSWHAILLTGPGIAPQKIQQLGEHLLATFPELHTFIHEIRAQKDLWAIGEKRILHLRKTDSPMAINLLGQLFALDPANFFQVNTPASQRLARVAVSMANTGDGPLLDLYCGVGSPGLLTSHPGGHGMEASASSIKYARQNALRCNKDWQYEAGKAGKLLHKLLDKNLHFPTVLADPPRAGMEKEALTALLRLKPGHLVYISCNPATLARDSRILQGQYELKTIQPVDMFPHTPHLETCTLWEARQ